jgi:hypothetical protein
MSDFPSSKSLETYFYDGQIKNRITQFAAVFSGLQVSVGKNDFNSTSNLITVPVRYGNADRVVNAILAENAQKPISLPLISFYVSGIEQAPEMRKGVDQYKRKTVLPSGGSFPDGLKVVETMMPIPYMMTVELNTYASNEDQNFQMLEQILMLFNPNIILQTSDDLYDWNKIFSVELLSINNQTNYPSNQDARIIQNSLTFAVRLYLSPPANIKNNYIKEIKLRLAAITASDGPTTEVVKDVNRPEPPYKDLFDIDRYKFPK